MAKLSDRQQQMLDFIRKFLEEHGYPPTIRDIQRGCEISSTSVVDYNLHILQREGHIRRSPEVSRGLELLEEAGARARSVATIPVMGYIAAGQPVPVPSSEGWTSQPLDVVEVPKDLTAGPHELYALKVRGHSMIDALIDEGDTVIIRPARMARNGDMVVAWLKQEKEATLKRFYHEGDKIRLQPANTQMSPIHLEPENVEVQGKVVAVLRRLE